MLASQRIESVMDFSGESSYDDDDVQTKRGAVPSLIELFILSWVSGKHHKQFFLLNSYSPMRNMLRPSGCNYIIL